MLLVRNVWVDANFKKVFQFLIGFMQYKEEIDAALAAGHQPIRFNSL
jgi:hypothetical protein